MILAVEGPDCSGKSTYCKYINDRSKGALKIVKLEYKIPETLADVDTFLEVLKNGMLDNDNVIFDRFLFSELVYGKIKRGYNPKHKISRFIEMNRALLSNVLFVFVVPEASVMMSRLDTRGDNYVTREELLKIRTAYIRLVSFLKSHKLNFMFVDKLEVLE